MFNFILGKRARREWTKEQKQAVHKYLEGYIRRGVVPGKSECEKCKVNADGALDGREWKSIKYYVKKQLDKRGKKGK